MAEFVVMSAGAYRAMFSDALSLWTCGEIPKF